MQILPQLAAELPHALNHSGGCLRWDRWVRRPPLRLAGELHYGNTLAGLEGSLMRFLGPGSAARQALLRCACKVVLVTRVRQPSSWYRSFWSWSGVRDRQSQNATLYGETLIEFARGYANLQSMLMLGSVNLGLQAQYVGINNPKVDLSEYRCFHPSGYAPQSRRARSVPPPGLAAALERCGPDLADRVEHLRGTLRKFDVVGLLERFEETLLLIADLVGLQHLLRPSANVASPASTTTSDNTTLLGCANSLDCDVQLAAAAPVDELMYAEVSASFAARVEAQGEEFARRVQQLKEARALVERQPRALLPFHKKKKEVASNILNLTLTRHMCRGLLAGEGAAAERLCRHVVADTQFVVANDSPEWAEDDLEGPTHMHSKT